MYWATLAAGAGSEQQGRRPVLIIQNDVGNRFAPTTIVLALTTQLKRPDLPVHVLLSPEDSGLNEPAMVLAEQVFTLSKERLQEHLGRLPRQAMEAVDRALRKSLTL